MTGAPGTPPTRAVHRPFQGPPNPSPTREEPGSKVILPGSQIPTGTQSLPRVSKLTPGEAAATTGLLECGGGGQELQCLPNINSHSSDKGARTLWALNTILDVKRERGRKKSRKIARKGKGRTEEGGKQGNGVGLGSKQACPPKAPP